MLPYALSSPLIKGRTRDRPACHHHHPAGGPFRVRRWWPTPTPTHQRSRRQVDPPPMRTEGHADSDHADDRLLGQDGATSLAGRDVVGLLTRPTTASTPERLTGEFRTSRSCSWLLAGRLPFRPPPARPACLLHRWESTGSVHTALPSQSPGRGPATRRASFLGGTTLRPSRQARLERGQPQDSGISLETRSTPTAGVGPSRGSARTAPNRAPHRHRGRSSSTSPAAVQQPAPTNAFCCCRPSVTTRPIGPRAVGRPGCTPAFFPLPPLPAAVREGTAQRRLARREARGPWLVANRSSEEQAWLLPLFFLRRQHLPRRPDSAAPRRINLAEELHRPRPPARQSTIPKPSEILTDPRSRQSGQT